MHVLDIRGGFTSFGVVEELRTCLHGHQNVAIANDENKHRDDVFNRKRKIIKSRALGKFIERQIPSEKFTVAIVTGQVSPYPIIQASEIIITVCSGSVVVTAYDSESGRPGSNPEWGLIYYEAPITAQGVPEPSSLRGSTLGTRAAELKGCNWACKLTDGCSPKNCVWPHLLAYATEIKSTACSASVTGLRGAQ